MTGFEEHEQECKNSSNHLIMHLRIRFGRTFTISFCHLENIIKETQFPMFRTEFPWKIAKKLKNMSLQNAKECSSFKEIFSKNNLYVVNKKSRLPYIYHEQECPLI